MRDKLDAAKHRYEREQWRLERTEALFTEANKALALLNSAGAATMLAFMQALIGKADALNDFKVFGIAALSLFLIGAFSAAGNAAFRLGIWLELKQGNRDSHGRDKSAAWNLMIAMGCFTFGSLAVVFGIFFAL